MLEKDDLPLELFEGFSGARTVINDLFDDIELSIN
jgi:hypothetical protein